MTRRIQAERVTLGLARHTVAQGRRGTSRILGKMPTLPRRSARHDTVARPVLLPPLKWAGGKRWQVPVLRPLWQAHAHRRLVEPFCGGLATALGLLPERALLNDLNPHVINFYRWLKRGLHVCVAMENTPG